MSFQWCHVFFFLQEIMLQWLQLHDVHIAAFCGLRELESLDLRFNKLNKVPELAPVKPTLVKLLLAHNQLSRFPNDYFRWFVKLRYLDVGYNHLEAVPSLGWLGATLKILYLPKNNITSIKGIVAQKQFRELYSIDLFRNKISVFDVKILSTMPKLRYLNLYGNSITHMENYRPYFSHSISLFENPFHCGIRMAWIATLKSDVIRSPVCATPWCLEGMVMFNMSK